MKKDTRYVAYLLMCITFGSDKFHVTVMRVVK